MAHKNRDKEYWLIPKRANLHQSIMFIKGIIDLNYDSKTWNGSKQDRLGSYLGKNGATKNGKNITPQAVRTLLASIPQYFGFLHINASTTPNTIVLTDAGKKLVSNHLSDIKMMNSLVDGDANGDTIKVSQYYLKQFEKLQITNPIILKDCENIFVFPLLVTYKLLLELGYLDIEEFAYIVFKIKDHTELSLAAVEINHFRKIDLNDRRMLIDAFRATHLGNISLVKAATTSYYIQLLKATGLFDEIKIEKPNPLNTSNEKIKAIKIKEEYLNYICNYIKNVNFENTYNFGDNVKLWIDYIGDESNTSVPKDISFINRSDSTYILNIEYNGNTVFSDLIGSKSSFDIPMFHNKAYRITCTDLYSGKNISNETILINDDIYQSGKIIYSVSSNISNLVETTESISNDILRHTESKNFDKQFTQYLTTIEKITGKNFTTNKNLRGGRLEYLFYKLLALLLEKGVVDDIYWNGKISQYGLPTPAPGGKHGIPDIVFVIENKHILLELTTIKAKSGQWNAEGSSVPDHINHYKHNHKVSTIGLFVAPIHHARVTKGIDSQLDKDVKMYYLTDKEFINLLLKEDRLELLEYFK
ncbi:MAG: AlwI family type II restriction endonuclease [Bacilli bacterium]